MKKQAQLGLVVEGRAGTSSILRLPNLADELGPVKSATLRVARRHSNMLRAGYAVADYEDLQAARLVLLRVPDESVGRIVEELCTSEVDFRGIAFILFESWLTADVLEPLRRRGSSIATVVALRTPLRNWFAVEGQISAVRLSRRLLERNDMYSVELRAGSKPLLFVAEMLTTMLPIPLFVSAQHLFRVSGISGKPLAAVLEEMAKKMFHDFSKGGRVVWGGLLNECPAEMAKACLEFLRQSYPNLAGMVEEQLNWATKRTPERPETSPAFDNIFVNGHT